MNAIELNKISKKRENFFLEDIDLKIPEGFITGFIGPNGAGKSTIIKIIMDVIKADNGEVLLFGEPHDKHMLRENIGIVYDNLYMYEDLTLKQIKKSVAPFYRNWDEKAYESYIEKFKLPDNKKLKHFSKGMTMKASLILALSHAPRLIIMDEPTSGLDPLVRRDLLGIIRDLMIDEQKTVFFSSHITTDLDNLADYIVFIYNGKIVFQKDIEEIKQTFHIVKGHKNDLSDNVKSKLVSWEHTDELFTGLLEGSSAAVDKNENILIEEPTLEDIMYYKTKERS
ncbi:ABC-2 type transport system ATP-binding protein [Bacillus pakistanensis]|uniref:ABC-2 type transport system ATP-binding protein n=1 Tax=Rossellomorea pakistanensis TaxID=992288 RepID=A0ABS2NIN5_9BACI|nr:ABC transporter ATP-binding protein [Bacillus pakistanensis]MBM7587699.1 ABC-2 type transport system ATP-binding protein [Bacillus pakistanensis]